MVQGMVSHDVTNAIEQVMPEANLSYGFRRRPVGFRQSGTAAIRGAGQSGAAGRWLVRPSGWSLPPV